MDIILYGAGIRGKKIENMLFHNGITIKGFADTYKQGEVQCKGSRSYPILNIKDLIGTDVIVVVTIADQDTYFEVTEMLRKQQIKVAMIEDIICGDKPKAEKNRDFIAEYHVEDMDDWFDRAEEEESLRTFWQEDSIYLQMFRKLNIDKVVELACGRGRHVPKYMNFASEVVLVDVLQKNIDCCKERFKNNSKVKYYCNNGHDLHELESEKYTGLFTYDAVVHFELLDIYEYLKETFRILESGGRALFHHSNNNADYRITFSNGTHGRNYMSKDLFAYLADRAGLKVLEQQVVDWGDIKDLDCLSLVEKPT